MQFHTLLLVLPVLALAVSALPAIGVESAEKNWSDDDETEENGTGSKSNKEEVAPEPIISVPPVPPIAPAIELVGRADFDESSENSATLKPVAESKEDDGNDSVTPLKIPFIPVSSVWSQLGTVLKPGGFNGMKPVTMPRQVQSLPYEAWKESPLSMAPKKTAKIW